MNLIAYYRASTEKQGRSGLGLEAQQAAVSAYAHRNNGRILKSYQEVESGKRCDRPVLAEALQCCKRFGAILVVAKLDRLSRDTKFLLGVLDAGVEIVFLDLPQLGLGNPTTARFFVTMMAAVAELEGRLISQRTKDAMAACRERGQLLGARRPGAHQFDLEEKRRGGPAAAKARLENNRRFYEPWIGPIREQYQRKSPERVVRILNRAQVPTRTGTPWTVSLLHRVVFKYCAEAA